MSRKLIKIPKKKVYKDKYDRLKNAPVKGLITSLAVPTVFTMLVSAIYNMADSYFVGKIDTVSVAAIGIVFPAMTLLQAVGFFLGNGSGINISTLLGKSKKERASHFANVALITGISAGVVLAVIGVIFPYQIAAILGASDTTKELAADYLRCILLGSPFILGSFILNNHLRYQGSAVYSMLGIVSGSIINIALDPLFIFTFDLGVTGAAVATVIGQAIGFFILVGGTFKNDNIRISLKSFKPSKEIYLTIMKNGLPSLARQGVGTLANISLNLVCSSYGDAVVAGMSVFNRVMFFAMAIIIGYGQGYQPVCSFNNGAKQYKRVYDGYKFTAEINTIIVTVLSVFGFIFAPELIGLFRDDPQVIEVGAQALRYQCIAMPLTGFCTASNMLMQSLKLSGRATILALGRQGIFYIPLMFILPHFFGQARIASVQPAADILSFIITLFLALPEVKRLKKNRI
ncbi:MAG: MATE family efflux transporter [Clostridiales bacterium]|nr:MATE family efflux transporter [Clostridiales bacterium]